MARKRDNDNVTEDEAYTPPPVGERTRTAEHSHESISNGDGTARQVPIVNASGEYPPRPEADNQ